MSSSASSDIFQLFESLCDLSLEEVQSRLSGEPEPVRRQVLDMIAADREQSGVLDDSQVLWVAMGMLETSEVPAVVAPPGYALVREIGSGGMGVVYEAIQEQPRRRVAIKFLRASALQRRALREAQALADVHHLSIPHLIEVGEAGEVSFLVMELVDGQALTVWGEQQPLRARLAALVEICRGVEAAHQAGVLHCDLKPDNLLVQPDGRPRILDFGLARFREGGEQHRSGGTLRYMADELLRGGVPTARTEVYALGVVLYELLAGCPPGETTTTPRAMLRSREQSTWCPPSRYRAVPAALDAIAARALAVDPADRYASPAALADDLDCFCADLPVSAHAPGARYRLSLWRRRNRGLLRSAALALLALAVISGGVVALERWQAAQREAAALERLVSSIEYIDRLMSESRPEDARQFVAQFTQLADNNGTAAPSRLWAHFAEHLAGDEARQAWASAYSTATVHADQARAAEGLVAASRVQADWVGLERMLRTLPEGLLPTGLRAAQSQEVFAAQRDFSAALQTDPDAPVAPILEALQGGVRTGYRPVRVETVYVEGERLLAILLQEDEQLLLVWPDPSLRVLATISMEMMMFGYNQPFFVQTDPIRLVGFGMDSQEAVRIWSLDLEQERLVLEDEQALPGRLYGAVMVDFEGSGSSELILSSFRESRLLRQEEVGAEVTLPHPDPIHDGLLLPTVSDLDGDGREEVVVSVLDNVLGGEAIATSERLRLLGLGPDGRLTQEAAMVLAGQPRAVSLERLDGRPALAVVTLHEQTLRLDLMEMEDGALVISQQLSVAIPWENELGDVLIGDLDGDGLDDVIVHIQDEQNHTWLVRQLPDGGLAGVLVGELIPLAATQLDDDPADELMVRLVDDAHHLWMLGVGEAPVRRLPPVSNALTAAQVVPAVQSLAELGLLSEAARILTLLAPSEPDPRVAASQLHQASRLHQANGEQDRARQVLEQALTMLPEADSLQVQIRTDLLALLAGEHRYVRMAELGAPTPVRAVAQDIDLLSLHRSASVLVPEALRYREDGLHIDALGLDETIFEIPIQAGGEQLGIEAELLIQYAEPGAWLRLELLQEDTEAVVLAIEARTWGDDERVDRALSCHGVTDFSETIFDRLTERFHGESTASARIELSQGELLCQLRRDAGAERLIRRPRPGLPAGRYRLRLRMASPERYRTTRFTGKLLSLRLLGATVLPRDVAEPWVEPWLSARLEEALDRVRLPRHRLQLLARLSRLSALRELLTMELEAQSELEALMLRELRLHPDVWIPILFDHDQQLLHEHYAAAWEVPMLLSRSGDAASVLSHPRIDELSIETERQDRVHIRRARLLQRLGQPARALFVLERLLARSGRTRAQSRELSLYRAELIAAQGGALVEACQAAARYAPRQELFADLVVGEVSQICKDVGGGGGGEGQ